MNVTFRRMASVVSVAALFLATGIAVPASENPNEPEAATEVPATTQEIWLKSLLTDTPQEGRELAIKLARKSIGAIQTDPEVRKRLRPEYATDTEQLILAAQVIAIEFQTIAAANNYWRDQ